MQQPTHDDPDDDLDELTDTSDASLRRLRHPAWPSALPTFGEENPARGASLGGCCIADVMRSGLVAARRFTCAFDRERFDAFAAADPARRTVIVHALDAGPSVPLLIYWLLANVDLLTAFRIRAHAEFKSEVLFVLPSDVPDAFRAKLDSIGVTRWIAPRYPAGNWRLMPHVARTSPEHTLTLDAVAAVDLAVACDTGTTPIERPVAFETAGDAPRLRRAARGRTLGETLRSDRAWACGPALAAHAVDDLFVLGDGELAFYQDGAPHQAIQAAACVRCGACVTICPTHCDPVALLHVAARPHRRAAVRAGLDACIDCGLCTASCPSAIPLHHVIDSLRRGLAAGEST